MHETKLVQVIGVEDLELKCIFYSVRGIEFSGKRFPGQIYERSLKVNSESEDTLYQTVIESYFQKDRPEQLDAKIRSIDGITVLTDAIYLAKREGKGLN